MMVHIEKAVGASVWHSEVLPQCAIPALQGKRKGKGRDQAQFPGFPLSLEAALNRDFYIIAQLLNTLRGLVL